MRKLMALEKRRKLPKRSGKTFKMYTYPLLAPIQELAEKYYDKVMVESLIRPYSDYVGISQLFVQRSYVSEREVYRMLHVDKGQEW
jgi:hypothetical protein